MFTGMAVSGSGRYLLFFCVLSH